MSRARIHQVLQQIADDPYAGSALRRHRRKPAPKRGMGLYELDYYGAAIIGGRKKRVHHRKRRAGSLVGGCDEMEGAGRRRVHHRRKPRMGSSLVGGYRRRLSGNGAMVGGRRKLNPWTAFLAKYRRAHPEMRHDQPMLLKHAGQEYRGMGSVRKSSRRGPVKRRMPAGGRRIHYSRAMRY